MELCTRPRAARFSAAPTPSVPKGINVISMVSLPNFMQGAGGSYPTTLPQLNVAQLLAFLKSLNGKPNPFYCAPPAAPLLPGQYPGCSGVGLPVFNLAETLPQANPYNSYDVTEKTILGVWRIDVRRRPVGRKLGSCAWCAPTPPRRPPKRPRPRFGHPPSVLDPDLECAICRGARNPRIRRATTSLPLPSANFNYWAVPDRAAAASRGGGDHVAPRTRLLGADLDQQRRATANRSSITTAPPGLKPIKATQVDFSAEWYYHPHSALTVALFGKKIRDDIYTGTLSQRQFGHGRVRGRTAGRQGNLHPFPWTVTRPANGCQEHFLRHRARLAAHHGQWLRCAHAVHPHLETRATIRTATASAPSMPYRP